MRFLSIALASITLASVALTDVASAQSATSPTFPAPIPATGSPWDGLNLLLTRQRLLDIQTAFNSGDPIATQACTNAIADANGFLTQTPNPIVGVLSVPSYYSSQQAVQQQITGQIRGDGRAALSLAWGYALTGQQSFADASKQFIWAWVNNLTTPKDGTGDSGFASIEDQLIGETGGDTGLVTHYSFPLFIYAYDILNGFGQISSDEQDQFKRWLAPFIMYRLSEEEFVNNHQNWQVLFMGAAAHVTCDQNLMNMAVAYYRDGMHHQQIALDGAMWRELARGEKAATYSLMALEAMVQFVVIANNHGVTDLRDVVADSRSSWSEDAIELSYVANFGSSGVSSQGGSLQCAFGAIRDFVNDPTSWNRWQNVIQSNTIDGPANASDWGWVFEVGFFWWQDGSYQPLMQEAPYGNQPDHGYTLCYSTLLFRPFGVSAAPPPPQAPAPPPPSSGGGFWHWVEDLF